MEKKSRDHTDGLSEGFTCQRNHDIFIRQFLRSNEDRETKRFGQIQRMCSACGSVLTAPNMAGLLERFSEHTKKNPSCRAEHAELVTPGK